MLQTNHEPRARLACSAVHESVMKTIVASACLLLTFTSAATDVGVRVRFGLTDKEPAKWDGSVTVSPGKVTSITGWRFTANDKADGTTGWSAATRRQAQQARNNNPAKAAAKAAKGKAANPQGPITDNGVILNFADVTEDSVVEITTPKGKFNFKLRDVPFGKFTEQLDGAVEVERVASGEPLTSVRTDDDYPAAAIAADGTVYVAYVSFTPGLDRDERARRLEKAPEDFSYLAKPAGGDQVWLRVHKAGKWSEPVAVTAGKGDIYKCAVTVDGKGRAWIAWAENVNYQAHPGREPNFEIRARSFSDGKLSETQNLTSAPGNDICPVATTDANGNVWVAWMGVREGRFQILTRKQSAAGSWSPEQIVSSQKRNCWTPAIAATAAGKGSPKVAIAWDTYDKGDYDVWVREFSADGKATAGQPAANTVRYEARPCLTYDHDGALWIAWEESGATWGKDWGALVLNKGIPLYQDRQIGLRVLKDGKWLETVTSHTKALPGNAPRRGVRAQRVPALEPEGESRKQAQEAESRAAQAYNNLSRIVTDRDGRVWLLARSRLNDFRSPIGSVWAEFASYYDGKAWVGPILIPHSDALLYNVPAVVAAPDGGLLVAHSTDGRQTRALVRRPQQAAGGNDALAADGDPYDYNIYFSKLAFSGKPGATELKPAAAAPANSPAPAADVLKEDREVARSRAYRATVHGKELRIVRGEFHRHTEISGDGGNDGPLEDMWRYALDVAAMDWIGCGDHDNGNGREYTWWLTQKTTDAFRIARQFEPMFTYERSVRYPEGHRNVVFAERGVRTLPRLPISDENIFAHAPDTQMLYKYLKHFGGVCASHTSATNMGTDWRDWDPDVEPMVEIYQGCRQNYERPGAPRCPSENDSIGGWRPKGFVNLAFQKGYRFSFESSSDHRSTHISYALVYAEDTSREAILKAMKARHVYGATDNIIADYRCSTGGEHFMGEEFTVSEAPTLKVKLIGTAPFDRVVLVKDDVETVLATPKKAEVELTWTDPNPTPGKTSYYYVRGEQAAEGKDLLGELVWVSPMWITYQPKK